MWNHNIHYHRYLLRQIPRSIDRGLDVGCGLGLFAWKLAQRARAVDAIDADSAVLAAASNRYAAPNLSYLHADFVTADLPEAAYDVIVSIASLHHMNLEVAFKKMKRLLRASGRLVILGLYRETTLSDYAYSAVSVPLNLMYSLMDSKWHGATHLKFNTTPTTAAPICSAQLSLKQIAAAAHEIIPGFRLKRHLFWRYSLVWQKP